MKRVAAAFRHGGRIACRVLQDYGLLNSGGGCSGENSACTVSNASNGERNFEQAGCKGSGAATVSHNSLLAGVPGTYEKPASQALNEDQDPDLLGMGNAEAVGHTIDEPV